MKGLIRFIASLRKRWLDEKGQVLILTALAGTALVGFLALALDIGNLYLVRRNAQNAADAAALVGAQNWNGVVPNVYIVASTGVQDARRYAIKNGFKTDAGANNHTWNQEVRVDVPPVTGPNAGKPDHIEVNIKREAKTLFLGIFGIDDVDISARAVARSKRVSFDAATISLDPGDSSTVLNGAGNVVVWGNTYSRGVTKAQTGSGSLNVIGNAYARGGFTGSAIYANALVTDVPDLMDPGWTAPAADPTVKPSWNSGGKVERGTIDDQGYLHIWPGSYEWISISSGDKVKFEPGVYRLTRSQGVKINGEAVGTGPVCFVLEQGTFDIQAGATVSFYSDKNLYNNILIWSAVTGDALKIAGGANVSLWGTIYTPNGNSRIAGTAGGTVHGQVVARNIVLDGNSGSAVVWDGDRVPDVPGPVLVE